MGERAASAATMPVFLIWFGYHRVPDADPLSIGPPSLHPAVPLDDVEQLATGVRVPVNSSRLTRSEPPRQPSKAAVTAAATGASPPFP
jgi:hypothetical protein